MNPLKSSMYNLSKNEVRMLYNQFKQTIRTPSMLLFYCITLFGIFFVSLVVSSMLTLSPLITEMGSFLKSTIDRNMIFAAFAFLSATSVVGGYFGIGIASGLTSIQEVVLLPAPVLPYKVFLSNYLRRIVRKTAIALIGLMAILPLLTNASLLFYSASLMIVCLIIFLETNYLLGAVSSYIRFAVEQKTKSRFRHLVAILLGILLLLPALPEFTSTFTLAYLVPSNAFAFAFTEMTGLFSLDISYLIGFALQIIIFATALLLNANLCSYEYYELFSIVKGRATTEGNFSKFFRGEVDFSKTRFQDPMVWIMLKDFYSRLRTPTQIWKYVYAVVGAITVLYLNLFHPAWFRPIQIPQDLAFAIVPAFLLMMILLVQISSVTSMLSFVDEKENVYLLKASPFSSGDIVLAKFLLSLFEVSIAVIPACGFLIYILRIEGYLALVALAAPMTILFTAVGVAIGAYVPVLTNDPRTLPVPLAFSYPIIDLSLGALMIFIVAILAGGQGVLLALPLYCIGFTLFFLWIGAKALNTYR